MYALRMVIPWPVTSFSRTLKACTSTNAKPDTRTRTGDSALAAQPASVYPTL
jgi:hypothetical protein